MTLKERVENTGIKYGKLARMLGVSQSELSMWLNGSRPMPEKMYKHLVEILRRLELALDD